jgi:DNA-binding transcriptional LysR family regulator
METNRLKQFCAIVETGSMTKASQLLHITHSALSKSMRFLQDEIGICLLRPSGRGITPTEEGLKFYQRAKEFLEQEHRLFKLDTSVTSSPLRIGAVEIFLLTMCEQFHTNSLKKDCINLLDLDPGNMEHLIASRQLDYGITYTPFPMENIEIIEVGKYRLGCYFLKGEFAGKSICEIPFVAPAQSLSSNILNIKERDGWLASIYQRNIKYSVNLLSTAIELTLQGLCAIYIPDFVANKINQSRKTNGGLVEYPLAKNQKNLQRAFLLKHKDQNEDDTFKQLYKIVKNTISFKTDKR